MEMKTPFSNISGPAQSGKTAIKTLLSPQRDKSVQLLRYHPIWRKSPAPFAYHHMRPTDNGQGSRWSLPFPLESGFGTTLAGPLGIPCAAVLPPADGSLDTPEILTLPAQRFIIPLYPKPIVFICQAPQEYFLPFFSPGKGQRHQERHARQNQKASYGFRRRKGFPSQKMPHKLPNIGSRRDKIAAVVASRYRSPI